MTMRGWAVVGVVLSGLALGVFASDAEAQSVVVEGQVGVGQPGGYVQGQVQVGQPGGYAQPPPGYGQPTYVQPYAQPTYVQQPPMRRVQYVEQETSITGLWIPGIIVFGVSFVLTGTFASALSFNVDYYNYAWIPLVGPGLMLSEAENDDEIAGALVGGIGQLAGLTMFILGLVLKTTERVAVYALDRNDPRSPTVSLAAAPGGVGLSLSHF